jgi:cell division protein FtsI/penicillin-binding protein 2
VRRFGLAEDVRVLFNDGLDQRELRLAGNGLTVVEATPMQLARATCGLATGRLPELRLVRAIGENEVSPAEARALPLAEETLAFLRRALTDVTHLSSGTASAALAPGVIGYSIAAKTGSADYTSSSAEGDQERRVRKHTWVTGWLPAEDPRIVFVVFVHDTTATSSHGAVYVARQILESSELVAWLASHGVERTR